MPFMFFGPTRILRLPALAFAIWAQFKVKSTCTKYAEIGNHDRLRGADAAGPILRNENATLRTVDTYRHGRSFWIECNGSVLHRAYPSGRV